VEHYRPKWHSSHIFTDDKRARHVIELRNITTDKVQQVTIHRDACALCAALLAECIWPKAFDDLKLGLEMREIAERPASSPDKA